MFACLTGALCRFRIGARYYHDLAVTDASMLNVFTSGSGLDLNIHSFAGELVGGPMGRAHGWGGSMGERLGGRMDIAGR